MKNVKLCLVLLLVVTISKVAYGQNSEFKINVPTSLFGYVEGTYEYILSDESSIGLSAGFAYEDDFYFNAAAIPFYRFYFGKKRAAGFFAEGNGAVYLQDETVFDSINLENEEVTEVGIGLGLAIGFKLKTNDNWVFEILAGAGRNFNDDILDTGYPRLGLSLGKRF